MQQLLDIQTTFQNMHAIIHFVRKHNFPELDNNGASQTHCSPLFSGEFRGAFVHSFYTFSRISRLSHSTFARTCIFALAAKLMADGYIHVTAFRPTGGNDDLFRWPNVGQLCVPQTL